MSTPLCEFVLWTREGNLECIADKGKRSGPRRMAVATRRKVASSDADGEGKEGEVAGEGKSHKGGGEKREGDYKGWTGDIDRMTIDE